MAEDFGDFGFVDEMAEEAPKAKPKRKASQKRNMGLYAKSPQQRMQEAQAEQDFQDAIQAEKERQDDDMGFGDENAGSPQPAGQQQFAIWGQPSSGGTAGIVIPPFVPRDQRSKEAWNKGEIAKRDSDKMILAGSTGDFLIRKTKKGHVICVNDNGKLYQAQIRTVADEGLGTFMFSSRMFKTLGDVVKHLQRNPLYNQSGLPLYIDKPCR